MKGEYIVEYMEIALTGVLALGCIILALLLRDHKAAVLQYAAQLVQGAEQAIQGSGMGPAKKALVVAQLQAAGVRVNAWLSDAIDSIVAQLNAHGAWLAQQTEQAVAGKGTTDDNG